MNADVSKQVFDVLISDCMVQSNNSYISSNGRIIWMSSDHYKTANSYNVAKYVTKKKTSKKKK